MIKSLTILPRRDSIQAWRKKNPIVKVNELIVVDVNKLITLYKIGDGKHTYKQLPFHSLTYCLKHGYFYGDVKNYEHTILVQIRWDANKTI